MPPEPAGPATSLSFCTLRAALSDDTRQELIALREGGMTLAELKTRFPQLTGDQIREVLPPANKREATQRKTKEAKAKATEVTQGVGGRSGQVKSEPKAEAPKPAPTPRYVEDQDLAISLSERALAARQVMGRGALAEALDTSQSAVWRAENGRIHPTEVDALQTGLKKVEDRIAAGEFVKQEKQPAAKSPSKAALEARIADTLTLLREAAADKRVTKAGATQSAIERLDPPQPTQ